MSDGILSKRFDPFAGDPSDMFSLGTVSIKPRPPRRHPKIFQNAYGAGASHPPHLDSAARKNTTALRVFGEEDWLSMDQLVARRHGQEVEMFRRVGTIVRATVECEQPWTDAGHTVQQWVKLGIVIEEAGPAGERGWRLVSREPRWVEEGRGRDRHVLQVRGLPPEQQYARDKLEAKRAKSTLTYDRKARHRRQHEIEHHLRSVLLYTPDALVPPEWSEEGPIEKEYVGKRVDAAFTVVAEAHHRVELDRAALQAWIDELLAWAMDAHQAKARDLFSEAPARAALPPELDLPDDDGAALESLAF